MDDAPLDEEATPEPQVGRMSKGRVDALVRVIAITDAVVFGALILLAIFMPDSRTTFLIAAGAFAVCAPVGLISLRRAMYRGLDDPALR